MMDGLAALVVSVGAGDEDAREEVAEAVSGPMVWAFPREEASTANAGLENDCPTSEESLSVKWQVESKGKLTSRLVVPLSGVAGCL